MARPTARSRRRQTRTALPAGVLLLALATLPAAGLAQEAGEPPAAAPADAPITPIATADIATQAKTALGRMQAAERLAAPVREVARIAEELPALRQNLQEAGVLMAQLRESPGTFRQLELTRSRWQAAAERLAGWSERLATRSATLAAARQALNDSLAVWTQTEESLAGEEVPEVLRENVQQVLDRARQAEAAVHTRLNEILTLQAEITELADLATQGQDQVDGLMRQFRRQMLRVDAPPLWELLTRPAAESGLMGQARAILLHDRKELRSFLAASGPWPLLQLLLLFAFVAALLVLRTRSMHWDLSGTDRLAATHIFGRPLSSSVILTLMLTPLLYSQAPPLVYEINRILLVVPVLRLVPGLLVSASRRPLFIIAGLYLADTLADLTLEYTLLQRSLLLATDLLGVVAAVWIARREIDAEPGSLSHWLQRRLAYLAALLLAASALANILGNVSLASLLSYGTLISAYGAYILFAWTQVLGILIAVLLHSRTLSHVRSLSQNAELVRGRAEKLLNLLAGAVWLILTLYFFGLLGILLGAAGTALDHTWSLGSLEISLGSVLAFGLTVYVSVLLSRLIRFLFMEDVAPRLPLARGLPASISQLLNYTILSLGFLAALGAAGIELSRFAIMAGALGVGIGFGLQSLVNNFVSGLILIFERPMQVGDKVELGTHRGEVRRIGFRASTIRTFEGAEIIVPNGDLVAKEFTNWTLSDHMRRVDLPVGVAYGSDPQQVVKILVEVAKGEPDILERPEPKAHFMEFGDSSLNFMVRFWTPKFDEWWGVHSKFMLGAHQALAEAGITIPFPQRDLHLRSVDAAAADELTRRAAPPPIKD